MQETILVVDDEKEIADLVELYLRNENYRVLKCYNGSDALQQLNQPISLAILDVMLPDIDGFALCQKIRQDHFFPIIMLTARVEELDKITGLTLGADDYITKPFGMMEFVARVKAVLRRSTRQSEEKELTCGELCVCVGKHKVKYAGKTIDLTRKEFELLQHLMENKGLVMTRNQLLCHVWGYDFDGETRTVDVHVRTLRQKLGEGGEMIETVRGVGYRIGE